MTQKFVNNFQTTIAQTFGAADTSLYLSSVAGLPALTGGDYLLLTLFRKSGVQESGHEVVKVTAITGSMLTVQRAVEGAAASLFNVGDHVEARLTAGAMIAKQDALVSGTTIKTINNISILGDGNISASIEQVTYDNRATLRTLTPVNGDMKLVESLGLFRWASASIEPDDDETCFATASGAWLLECPHWDVADAMNTPDNSAMDDRDEDAETRLTSAETRLTSAETRLTSAETRWPGRILHGSANCAITSIASVTQVSFTVTVTGASVNDGVIATPPNSLGERIAYYARVTAVDTVTIYLNNPSAASQTIVTGVWNVFVIKEI